jgi:hypothetical protein
VNDFPQFLQIMLLSFAAIKFSGHFGLRRRFPPKPDASKNVPIGKAPDA